MFQAPSSHLVSDISLSASTVSPILAQQMFSRNARDLLRKDSSAVVFSTQYQFTKRPSCTGNLEVIGQRKRQNIHRRGPDRAASTLLAEHAVEQLPRQSASLPEKWEPADMEDAAIEAELKQLRPERAVLSQRLRAHSVSVNSRRKRVLRGRSFRKTARASDRDMLEAQRGTRLSLEEQAGLCADLQEWQRVQDVHVDLLSQSAAGEDQSQPVKVDQACWAKAAGLTTAELARVLQKGPAAAELLLESVHRLLLKTVHSCMHPNIDFEDVLMEAKYLWLEAALRFNPSRSSLNTFGIMYVRQRLRIIVNEKASLLDQPVSTAWASFKVRRAQQKIEEQLHRSATIAEIAAKANLSEIRVKRLLAVQRDLVSLDSPAPAGAEDAGVTLADTLPSSLVDGRNQNVDELIKEDLDIQLAQMLRMRVRPGPDCQILSLRYGLEDGVCHTLEEIGDMFNISKEAVRRKLLRSIQPLQRDAKLRLVLESYRDDGAFF